MAKTPKGFKPSVLFIPWENTGVGLYRVIIPAISLGNGGLADVETIDRFTGNITDLTRIDLDYVVKGINKRKYDIVYTTKPHDGKHIALCQTLQHYGIKWVLDMDDNIFEVNSDNPGHRAFDKTKKSDLRFFIEYALKNADAVVVSTENLKDVYESYNKNIYVSPNNIDFGFWNHTNKRGLTDKIVIGWAGAGGHKYDLSIIEDVIPELKAKYGDTIEFVSFGGEQPKGFDKHHNWVELHRYPEKLASLGFDIGIAPLRDNLYNRGKSNLRWLEYSALRIPTVASEIEPYKNTTALLCVTHDDWVSALSTLIENKETRQEMGEFAYRTVKRKFNAEDKNTTLLNALNDTIWETKRKSSSSKK